MIFYLGAKEVSWLTTLDVPAFLSRSRLLRFKGALPRSKVPWAMDSGGFTEVHRKGGWSVGARQFAREVRFWSNEIGRLDWVAPQDWMVEEGALKSSGKTIRQHQDLTLANYLELRAMHIPAIPVLQGSLLSEYLHHADMYEKAGVNLQNEARVGVGSVCRRQVCGDAAEILITLAQRGLKLHAFGLSTIGLRQACGSVASADSMAWSYASRKEDRPTGPRPPRATGPTELVGGDTYPVRTQLRELGGRWNAVERGWNVPVEHAEEARRIVAAGAPKGTKTGGIRLPGHTHADCRNCPGWAMAWRRMMLSSLPVSCVEDHPLMHPKDRWESWAWDQHGHAAKWPRGTVTTLELSLLFNDIVDVLRVNTLLDEEEKYGLPRGELLHREMGIAPPSEYRARVKPDAIAAYDALPAKVLARVDPDFVKYVKIAKRMPRRKGEHVVEGQDRSGNVTTYYPDRCSREVAASLLAKRRWKLPVERIGECEVGDAGHVLSASRRR